MMLAGSKLRCQLRPSNPVRSNSTWFDALGMFPDAQTISVYTISPPNVNVSCFTLSASKPCRKEVMGSSHEDGESLALWQERLATGNDKICQPPGKSSTRSPRKQGRPKKGKEGPDPMKTILSTVLDPTRRSNDARDFEGALRPKIFGQDQAVS